MNSRMRIYLAVTIVIAALAFAAMALRSYMSISRAGAQAEQVRRDMKPVHEEQAERKEQARVAEDANQKALTAALAALARQRTSALSESDLARIDAMIAARMGPAAQPKTEVPRDATGRNLPDAASTTLQSKALRDYLLDCDAATAQLGSCRQSVANLSTQLDAERRDHAATKQELQVTLAAGKGGGFLTRIRRGIKHVACSSGSTAAGITVGTKVKQPAAGLAVGVVAFGACELL